MPIIYAIVGLLIGAVAAAAITYMVLKPRIQEAQQDLEIELEQKRKETEIENQKLLETARREAKQIRTEAEKVIERRYADLARAEERVDRRSENLDKQVQKAEQREQILNKRQSRIDRRHNELETLETTIRGQLEQVANMTVEEAKQQLLQDVENEARQNMARIMREIEDEAKETANQKARELIAMAIQRIASDQVAEITVSTVVLPSEEMKGRIIGRSGRNIRAFEQAAGVDIVVDDTPEAVTISSFDPVRREVARRALEKLITDGRIHPARIEKLIKDAQQQVNQDIKEAGEQAAYEANVHGLHPQVTKMLG
ncbi:MAG TPA: Rnase Y domain-containing protein, partial [Chloroflexota bacterium]|nr:Rnase Y domain-containing protein [Chloroflexota bacterium]